MNASFRTIAAQTWRLPVLIAVIFAASTVHADVKLPNVFGDHMVLQQGQKNKVWGMAAAGEAVTVSINSQSQKTTADADGNWSVMLDALPVGGPYEMAVKGSNEIKFADILVGEVWVCSGQSNMQWTVNQSNDPDLEKLAAEIPEDPDDQFPKRGSQQPIWSHDEHNWKVCTPESVGEFLGRRILLRPPTA